MNGAMALVRTHSFYQSFITLSVIRKPDLPMTPLEAPEVEDPLEYEAHEVYAEVSWHA